VSQQSQQRRRGSPGAWWKRPGWAALVGALVATAGAVVAFAALGLGGGEREGPEIVTEASNPGPLESASPPPPDASDDVAAAHLIASVRRGKRVAVHDRPRGEVVERAGPKSELGSPLAFGVTGRRGSWLRVATPISRENRDLWIRSDRSKLRLGRTDLSIHANLSERSVELRRANEVLRRFSVTVGAPGSGTPSGRFAVTDTIVGGLDPVYGCCAIALSAHQPDLPPGWIGGDRVAIHGTSGPVGLAASSGCLRAADEDVRALIAAVPLGTPVVIRD